MAFSLDFASLRRLYGEGAASPVSVAREVIARIEGRGDDGVWISKVAAQQLLAAAEGLERRAATGGTAAMPLFGLPFAVKDNIDVAGLPTTAACPSVAYLPERSAAPVERLLAAGALLVGKTNLDQFATGLVGTRSPYGVPVNPFDRDFIAGGSSSGSAVAVSAGLVSFALATDTAGSGRVPASFNNIVGIKPSRGLVSTRGVVPACRSLDCVSVMALTVPDASEVLQTLVAYDPEDAYSRQAPAGFGSFGALPTRFGVGVPRAGQRAFFGNTEAGALYEAAIERLVGLGGEMVEIDFAPFLAAADLLYRGAWLAERLASIDAMTGGRRDLLHPVTRRVVEGGARFSAADAFHDIHLLADLRRQAETVWQDVDVLLLPTTGTIYSLAEVEADPLGTNQRLGYYTNFANLLDLAAIAVPNGFQANGLPAGVTLLAPAFHDPLLAAIAAAFHAASELPLGATGLRGPAREAYAATNFPYLPIAVLGAHLRGQPLNGELLALGARFRRTARTTPEYRLYALDAKRPGLVRRLDAGRKIELEIWDIPTAKVGAFLARIAPPLGLGHITLTDGTAVTGFLCEACAIVDARDISEYGGWRAWLASC